MEQAFPGIIRHVSVSDVDMQCESCIFLGGEANSPIQRVRMREIHMTMVRQGTQGGGLFDEQPSTRHIYPHSIPALYARHVQGLRLVDSDVQFVGHNEAWSGTYTETEACENVQVAWEGTDD